MGTTTYVCSGCRNDEDREYRVTHFIKFCENGCGFVKHIRKALVKKTSTVPDDARPESWASMDLDERLMVAMRAGVITRADLL